MSTTETSSCKVERSTIRDKGENQMHEEDANANLNSEPSKTDMDALEPDTLVIDGHICVECPEPANALDLCQHADPFEDEAWRMEILCEGCDHNKQARIYLRFVCADCGEVSWYQQVDEGTIH